METIDEQVLQLAMQAKQASEVLAQSSTEQRNTLLQAMASSLRANTARILRANAQDVEQAYASNTKESLIDRLLLTEQRIEDMACALEDLVKLEDPLGVVLEDRLLYNGMELKKLRVPLGVVAVVYEARPNVTADAAGICVKSGNAVVLRGGSLAAQSNAIISETLADAVEQCGFPRACVTAITTTDRAATDALMQLHGIVDVLVPRGGAGLISHCVACSKVPVIETGTGNCHVYVHESAQLDQALGILLNAKCRRYGVCNAAETLLVDAAIAPAFLPCAFAALAEKGVVLHTCEQAQAIAQSCGVDALLATEADWATEYLAPEIAVRVVNGIDEAIAHINHFGTKHSEAIVAQDVHAIEQFQTRVDAACVYANASTAFTDGGQFGLGAEIGISTQKLHVRGPFALEGLTTYKSLLSGTGQVR